MTLPSPSFPDPSPADQAAMRQALALARQAIALTEPNPRVGCVITDAAGRVLGQGHTQQAGGPHAEVMALRDAAARGEDVRGATAYVTLEPCSHHGRTPPCCDALVAAGLGRVVAAIEDPNVLVSGQGHARLRAAGIRVDVGLGGDESRELNIGFFSRMQRGRPWVRLKAAVSLDGRSALENGVSQWITGEAARTDGHAWRRRAGAVLTGVGTVRDDNPRLDVRLVDTPRQPLRVVLDSQLATPPEARILDAPGSVLIVAARADAARADALRARGAEIVEAPAPDGRVDLPTVLRLLGERGINELHVEAGRTLSGAFAQQRLVDEYLVYLAPKLLGRGRDLATFGPLTDLGDAVTLQFHDVERVGTDLRVLARP
ncbi:riboflavin biosynthesis protein RibD [Piscinibacter gummiphilus]|nr:riboflavin biosynthesis protein RibD [Piscinibacter gummiphilus]